MNLKTKIKRVRKRLLKEAELRDQKGQYRERKVTDKIKHWFTAGNKFIWAITMLIIGISWTRVYYEGRIFYSEEIAKPYTSILNIHGKDLHQVSLLDSSVEAGEVQAGDFSKSQEGGASKSSPSPKEITRKIYQLESSSGTNGTDQGCRTKGLYNGYGYNPGSCYNTRNEVASLVENWVIKKQEAGFTTAELLCLYNTGVATSTCEYYQNYLNLG